MNIVLAHFVDSEGVADGFATRLHREGDLDVPDGVPLSVNGAEGHAPVVWAVLGQLGDVVGHLTANNQHVHGYFTI